MLRLKLVFLLWLLQVAQGWTQQTPNIIFIVADDLGYGDQGCYGSKTIATPYLDKMAASGIRFTQAYAAAPMCTPSRTAFMTGRYPARTPVGLREPLDWSKNDSLVGLTPETPSIPSMLKLAGYTTHLSGKWHLGFMPEFSPLRNGFNSFFGYNGGGVDYVSHTDPNGLPDLFENDNRVKRQGYLTDLIAEDAIQFLKKSAGKPFFLSVQFSAPHWPWQAPGDSVYPLGNKQWKEGGSYATYAAMVQQLDANIGRILQTLEVLQISKQTLVVFTSDNGGERWSDVGALKGKKMVLWEGGIRVPLIAFWPGRIPAGIESKQPISHMDLTATFLALANAKPSPAFPLDGMDILNVLTDKSAPMIERTFYWRVFQRNKQKALRQGDWKYLQTEKGEYLFNLANDPFENNDLKASNTEKLHHLKQIYAGWEKTVLTPVPLGQ